MSDFAARKRPFLLQRDSFDCLLAALHPDRQAASVEYERLRTRLVRFFDWQGATEPENLADISLDRMAMKLHRGEQILDPRNYLHGIARMVLRESRNQRQREATMLEHASHLSPGPPESGIEELYQALEQSLQDLPSESRKLVLAYYSAENHREQAASRQRMAAECGISTNALRNRALRLRTELEQSTLRKLSRRKNTGDEPSAPRTY